MTVQSTGRHERALGGGCAHDVRRRDGVGAGAASAGIPRGILRTQAEVMRSEGLCETPRRMRGSMYRIAAEGRQRSRAERGGGYLQRGA